MRAALIGLALLSALGGMAAAPALAAPATMAVPSGKYVLDLTHASLTWRVMHFGLANYTARFAKFDATVELDAADVSKSSFKVSVDPTSVRTDFPYPEKVNFDAEVANEARFFNAKAFPELTFVSTAIAVTGPKTANITGNLTFRGVTKIQSGQNISTCTVTIPDTGSSFVPPNGQRSHIVHPSTLDAILHSILAGTASDSNLSTSGMVPTKIEEIT